MSSSHKARDHVTLCLCRCLPREDAQGQPEGEALPMLLRPCRGRHLHYLRAVVRSARGRLALHCPAGQLGPRAGHDERHRPRLLSWWGQEIQLTTWPRCAWLPVLSPGLTQLFTKHFFLHLPTWWRLGKAVVWKYARTKMATTSKGANIYKHTLQEQHCVNTTFSETYLVLMYTFINNRFCRCLLQKQHLPEVCLLQVQLLVYRYFCFNKTSNAVDGFTSRTTLFRRYTKHLIDKHTFPKRTSQTSSWCWWTCIILCFLDVSLFLVNFGF